MMSRQSLDVEQHMRDRVENCKKVTQLCCDYELHSTALDGGVLEILQQVQWTLNQDSDFLNQQVAKYRKELDEILVKVDDQKKILEQQTRDGYWKIDMGIL
jgi:hypothetical protein